MAKEIYSHPAPPPQETKEASQENKKKPVEVCIYDSHKKLYRVSRFTRNPLAGAKDLGVATPKREDLLDPSLILRGVGKGSRATHIRRSN